MGALLSILCLLGIVVVWLSRMLTRRSFLKGRKLKSLTDIHAEVQSQISAEVLDEVWFKVGEAFSVDPRLIEPNDTLKALSGIDSWDFGKGEDFIAQWIEREKFGKPPEFTTVLDLARWVQAARAPHSP